MRIELACAECGKNRFAFPSDGTDDDMVTCEDCGHVIGSLASLKDRVAAIVLGRSAPASPT
jgi:uncharacterized Zn finger protein